MVVKEDFEIQLVQADTKQAFLEHAKGDEVYVEVEPEVEYFIALRKVRLSDKGLLCCNFVVDQQDLGYYVKYSGWKTETECRYKGIHSRVNGTQRKRALKFSKPKEDPTVARANSFMGNVKICVYEGVSKGVCKLKDFSSPPIGMQPVQEVIEDKTLRSTEGQTTISSGPSSTYGSSVLLGTHLYTITLHYCTARGLIKAGILKPPDSIHQKKRSTSRTWMKSVLPAPKKITFETRSQELGTVESKQYEFFDFTQLSSGDDDDDDDNADDDSSQLNASL